MEHFIVITLTERPGTDCHIIPSDAMYPAIYSNVFGPAGRDECLRYVRENCRDGEETKGLYEQSWDVRQHVSTASVSIQLPASFSDGKIERKAHTDLVPDPSQMWLHSRGKSTCYFFRDVHEYEAFVTIGPDVNGQRVPVDKLTLRFSIAGERGSQDCHNSEWCAKTIEEYNLRCRSPRTVSARMEHQGWWAATGEAQW